MPLRNLLALPDRSHSPKRIKGQHTQIYSIQSKKPAFRCLGLSAVYRESWALQQIPAPNGPGYQRRSFNLKEVFGTGCWTVSGGIAVPVSYCDSNSILIPLDIDSCMFVAPRTASLMSLTSFEQRRNRLWQVVPHSPLSSNLSQIKWNAFPEIKHDTAPPSFYWHPGSIKVAGTLMQWWLAQAAQQHRVLIRKWGW